jgi:neopullulanase
MKSLRFAHVAALLAVSYAPLMPLGCGSGDELGGGGTSSGSWTGTGKGASTGAGGATTTGTGPGGGGEGGGPPADLRCPTVFTFRPPAGVSEVRIPGEWNGFDLETAPRMTGPDAQGEVTATVELPPGLHAYKIAYGSGADFNWTFDPGQGRRKYLGGVENSAVLVPDCRRPTFTVTSSRVARSAAGQGTYQAALAFKEGVEGTGPAPGGFEASLRDQDGAERALGGEELTVDATGNVTVSLAGLRDGKYRVTLRARTQNGLASAPYRLVFWVEAEAFSWEDAIVYMVLTDRYRDGDAGQNPAPTPGADPRGDWYGGDLLGLRDAIADGTLDALGVRAIWLTPFQTNPSEAFLASDGVHKVTGYHGYWPTRAREVDPRLGGEEALRAMVKEAHRHGIRVLQDYVVNHVHEQHEYVAAHPDWFRTGCVCGTASCDWTERALDCMFAPYLPDIDHTVPEANAAFVDDAVYWLDEFDLDGLRVDAVKHVEEVATRNLATAVRETFEIAGTKYFLMGETAMGWNDCDDPCNDENYGTIAKYIGPFGLDGQFDFVLYHGVSYQTFAYGNRGMLHAAHWAQHGLAKWPAGSIMTPYIGSHDTPRFVSLADYRGQDASRDRGIPGNQWTNTATAPTGAEPYERMRLAMAWLLGLPGAPLLYYGDEYGQWGGADPNNRLMWRSPSELDANETATLRFIRALGAARRDVPALRRGAYVNLAATEDTLVFGRRIGPGQAALVALTRAATPQTIPVEVASALGFAAGTTLRDALGGPAVVVPGNGTLSLAVPAKGARLLAP